MLLIVVNCVSVFVVVFGIVVFVVVVVFGFGKVFGSWMYDFDWFYLVGYCLYLGLS